MARPQHKFKFGVHRRLYRQLRKQVIRSRPVAVQFGLIYYVEPNISVPGQRYSLTDIYGCYDPLDDPLGYMERNGNFVWVKRGKVSDIDKRAVAESFEAMYDVYDSQDYCERHGMKRLQDVV